MPTPEPIITKSIASIAKLSEAKPANGEKLFNWNISSPDYFLIQQITARAVDLFKRVKVEITNPAGQTGQLLIGDGGVCLKMDLVCVHLNHKPLRLHAMLLCSDADLIEEISKISLCWNRTDGTMTHSVALKFTAEH